MNLRQKHKKLKRELEWYKKQMVPTREIAVDSRQMRVETLRAKRYFHDRYLETLDEEDITDILLNDLSAGIKDHMEIIGPIYDKFMIYPYYQATLRVIKPDGGDEI